MLSPAGSTGKDESGIEAVGAVVDPLPQGLAIGTLEGGLQKLAVLEGHHPPAHGLEELIDLPEQAVRDDGVEALAVVIDHPPEIANVMLPAFQQSFIDVALVQFRIAHERYHAAGLAPLRQQALQV